MQFDLTDLRLYVQTAEALNLTRAAAAQHLSLAAASARIKALEAHAGLPLFYREARGVRLTPAGEAFLHHARGVLRQTEQLRLDLQEYTGGLRGHLRVFANTTAVTDFMPEILPPFLAADPRIVAGQIDTLGLQAIHFSTDRLVLVTAHGHRFARRKSIAFAETLDEDAVGMQHGSTIQAFLAQVTERLGKPLRLRIQLASFDAMCRMIGAGVGIGVVPVSAARRNQQAMKLALIELTDAWAVRERYVLVRDQATLPPYTQTLVNALVAHYKV